MLVPREKTPDLNVPLVTGDQFDLSENRNFDFTLLVFYRGLHCPICASYLRDLEARVDDFLEKEIDVIAVSSDGFDRAEAMAKKIGADKLKVGYDMPLSVARSWGLYLSESRGKTSIGIEEPPVFPEPGVFAVRGDQTLFLAMHQTMPFARPNFPELLDAFSFVLKNDYPARGEYTGEV